MSSLTGEGGPSVDNEALDRLAGHIKAGGGADDIPAQRRELGQHLVEWSKEVAPLLAIEDLTLPADSTADTMEMPAITAASDEAYGWTPDEQPLPLGRRDILGLESPEDEAAAAI